MKFCEIVSALGAPAEAAFVAVIEQVTGAKVTVRTAPRTTHPVERVAYVIRPVPGPPAAIIVTDVPATLSYTPFVKAKVPKSITLVILKVVVPVAAAYVPSEGFETTTTQAPAEMPVTILPLTEQVVEVVLNEGTPLPDPPTGDKVIVDPTVVEAGEPEALKGA